MELRNTVIEQIRSRASVRSYRDESVSDDVIDACIDAAMRAPTSSNLQMWSAVVTRDVETRNRLAALSGDQRHIKEAPVFVTWCVDRARLEAVCDRRGYRQITEHVEDFLVAAIDASLAMQNATIAAESLGLGSCYIGGLRNNTREVIEILELPPLVFPISGMTLGWPAEPAKPKPRLDREAFLHHERYSQANAELIDRYDETMLAGGLYTGRQTKGIRPNGEAAAAIDASEYSWSEHSARRASRPVRTDLREVLEAQRYILR